MGMSLQMKLAVLPSSMRDRLLADMTEAELVELAGWGGQARPEQLEPSGGWSYWALIGGRGSGKTKAACEWVVDRIMGVDSQSRQRIPFRAERIGFVGRTAGDVRRVMIEGQSGIIKVAEARGIEVVHNPSRSLLTLTCPDGHVAEIYTYSADEPESLRGPEHDTLWADEFAAWPRKVDAVGNTALTNAQAGLRLSDHPRACFSSTPRPTPDVKAILKDKTGDWVSTRMTTWENAANLPAQFISTLQRQHGGTKLASQEFEGLLVEEVEGALWTHEVLEQHRVKLWEAGVTMPLLVHRAVAVDPSISFKGQGDECGIICGGVGADRRLYATHDYSIDADPDGWAQQVVAAYYQTNATVVVAEGNQGGAMVVSMVKNVDKTIPVELVFASDGKRARAEPIAQLWVQGRASMVGSLAGLEDQLTGWSKYDDDSPDRLDALAWLGHWALERMDYQPTAFNASAAQHTVVDTLEQVRAMPRQMRPTSTGPSRAERLQAVRDRLTERKRGRRGGW